MTLISFSDDRFEKQLQETIRRNEYELLCHEQGVVRMPYYQWLIWDRDVYQPYVRTAASPLSPATYQRLYGNKTMDEYNQKISPTLLREAQDRIQLLEDQLRLTEAALKTTQEERENYYNRNQSLESICNDMRSKVTALEHALGDVGEANSSLRDRLNKSFTDRDQKVEAIGKQAAEYLIEIDNLKNQVTSLTNDLESSRKRNAYLVGLVEKQGEDRHTWEEHYSYQAQLKAKDGEIAKLKASVHARNRPSLESAVETGDSDKYPALYRCLPQDVRVGDVLSDYRHEHKVTDIVASDYGFRIHFSGDFREWSSDQYVFLHSLATEESQLSSNTENKVLAVTPKTPANAVKYPHYFREVTNTTHIDVSWILKAYNVPCCEGHAIKKLLVSGQRGAKNRIQDLEEARDSIDRAIELEEESK